MTGRTLLRSSLVAMVVGGLGMDQQGPRPVPPVIVAPRGSEPIEQRAVGPAPAPTIIASFDGLGEGFVGPAGTTRGWNPSDNSLAVGPDHIVQIVNAGMAIFTKRGQRFDTTGRVLYGPVATNNVFRGFGGPCELTSSGDAVARYDQVAGRWLIVMPVFSRGARRLDQPEAPRAGAPATVSVPGVAGQPGSAMPLMPPASAPVPRRPASREQRDGVFSMCYAVSVGSDPFGPYYRYEFLRPLFPDYPRPAVWPDGYYVPTSTGDDRISDSVATQKHACVVERARMLRGEPAAEQCLIIENVNFLNNADLDGVALPPPGMPNVMLAAGGTQLDRVFEDSVLNVWRFHVDWDDPNRTTITGPERIPVAPYHYLCDGQLTDCVPQPGTDRRLDAQGDKLMARVVYRRIGDQQSIVAVHSVNTTSGGGGVRWYELRLDERQPVSLYQQGTFLSDRLFRWMASPAIDRLGNIGIGYSYGGADRFTGQRFVGRRAGDPLGQLTLGEAVLATGEAAQVNTRRWEDYTQTAVDPVDDCTIWYVGDYFKKDASGHSTRIGALRLPGC